MPQKVANWNEWLENEKTNILYASFPRMHDDVIKWKHFPRHWPFVRGIHRSPVNSLHKGQWHGALMFSLICAWIKGWVNNRVAGGLRRHRVHYDITVMTFDDDMHAIRLLTYGFCIESHLFLCRQHMYRFRTASISSAKQDVENCCTGILVISNSLHIQHRRMSL